MESANKRKAPGNKTIRPDARIRRAKANDASPVRPASAKSKIYNPSVTPIPPMDMGKIRMRVVSASPCQKGMRRRMLLPYPANSIAPGNCLQLDAVYFFAVRSSFF